MSSRHVDRAPASLACSGASARHEPTVSSRGVEAPDSHPNESIQAIQRLLVVADADRFRHAADGRLDTVLGHLHSISAHARGDALRGSVLTVLADAVAQF